MADTYYIDKRAEGANTGDPDGAEGPDVDGIYQAAFQSIADIIVLTNPIAELVFVEGSSSFTDPYLVTTPWLGWGNNKTITGNGNYISGEKNLNGSAYKWTQSAANPLEYYIEDVASGDPSLSTVTCGTINGRFQEGSSEEATYQMGSAGSLSDEFFAWQTSAGSPDSLAFNTIYARYDAGLESIDIRVAQVTYVLDDAYNDKVANDFKLMYANIAPCRIKSAGGVSTYNNVHSLFGASAVGGHGFEFDNAGAKILNFCLAFFTGHRGYNIALADSGDVTLNGCIDINAHLFANIHVSFVNTFTMNNCIGYNEPSGVLDTNANVGGTIVENYNCFYPSFSSGTSAEYPDGTDNTWTLTGANSIPSSASTDINSLSAWQAAGALDPQFTNIDLRSYENCDFSLKSSSPCIDAGVKYWTSANPVGQDGEPFSDFDTSMGANQSKDTPFHPTKL